MIIATLLNLLALILIVGIPGWLIYRLWLYRFNLSWRVGIALVLAVHSILFSDLASLFHYTLPLTLTISLLTLAVLVILWIRTRTTSPSDQRLQGEGRSLSLLSAIRHSPFAADGWHFFHLLIFGFFLAPAFVLYLPLDTGA